MKQKLKTKSSAKKRFKLTAKGKVKGSKANRRHILTPKPQKRKRQTRRGLVLANCDAKVIKKLLCE